MLLLAGNRIATLHGLARMASLEMLDLSHNYVAKARGWRSHTQTDARTRAHTCPCSLALALSLSLRARSLSRKRVFQRRGASAKTESARQG
eukprot:6189083-Pleurochrysis_carterae.AAC.1